MKIDRLLGIITVLLQREKVTAPELALKFEVSRRTINRDVEDICKAGIPIITFQGGAGGISIAEGYKIDKTVISVDELQNIIAGLKSLESVSATSEIERLIMKLSPNKQAVVSLKDKVIIDLASHYKNSLSDKISLLKSAISQSRLVSFDYFSDKGVSKRLIEPYFITFKWSSWYIYGFCISKKEFRLFKLNRLWNHLLNEEHFEPRSIPIEDYNFDNYFTDENRIVIMFDKAVEYLLVEEYGPNCYEITDEGKLRFSAGFSNRDHIVRWILSFGNKATVIEPVEIKEQIKEMVKNIIYNYERDI
jgi:predicted DNA-binding transcriptional regulator YafY